MDLEPLQNALLESGWRDVEPGRCQDIDFDLIGWRRFLITKWRVLVQTVPVLDQPAVQLWAKHFDKLSRKSKGLIWGECFLLCLVCDEVAEDIVETAGQPGFGVFNTGRIEGGGGNAFVVDCANQQVYGNIPEAPYDVHTYSAAIRSTIESVLFPQG